MIKIKIKIKQHAATMNAELRLERHMTTMAILFRPRTLTAPMPPLTGLGRVVAGGFYKHVAPAGAMEIAFTHGDLQGPGKLRQERHVYR